MTGKGLFCVTTSRIHSRFPSHFGSTFALRSSHRRVPAPAHWRSMVLAPRKRATRCTGPYCTRRTAPLPIASSVVAGVLTGGLSTIGRAADWSILIRHGRPAGAVVSRLLAAEGSGYAVRALSITLGSKPMGRSWRWYAERSPLASPYKNVMLRLERLHRSNRPS